MNRRMKMKLAASIALVLFVCFLPNVEAEPRPAEADLSATTTPAPATKEPAFNPHVPIIMYSNAVTIGSSRDFLGDYSARGMALEYRYRVMPELSVGALLGLQNFSDKQTGLAERENVAVWGTHVRQLEVLPLVATVHYYYVTKSGVLPFVGTDLGAYYKWRYVDYGWGWLTEDKWHFGVAPQVGVMIPAGPMNIMVSSKFNYLVKSGDAPDELFFSFHVGLAFIE